MGVWEGGAGGGGWGGGGAGGRASSGRGFLGRPRFRFTGGALEADPPPDGTSRGRLLAFPLAFWTTEVGAAGACCCCWGGGGGGGATFSLSYDRQLCGRIISGTGPPCCWGSVAMAMTFTPPPLAAAAAAGPPGPDAPPMPEASLGASEGGEERTESWVLSGMELRGRILGNCFMKASTCVTSVIHVTYRPFICSKKTGTQPSVTEIKMKPGVNLPQDAERREEEERHPGRKVWLPRLVFLQAAASVKTRRKSLRVPSEDRQGEVSSSDRLPDSHHTETGEHLLIGGAVALGFRDDGSFLDDLVRFRWTSCRQTDDTAVNHLVNFCLRQLRSLFC